MSVTIGSYSAPDPTTTYTRALKPIGASCRALTGDLVSFYSAVKNVWTVRWSGLTDTIRDLIMAELGTQALIAWIAYEEIDPIYVRVISAKWLPTPSGESCFDVECELEEA